MIGEPDPSAERDNVEAPEDVELGRALEAYLADIEAGRPADAARLIAAHPRIAGQLRACLQVMNLADRMVSSASGSASGMRRAIDRLDFTTMAPGQSGLSTISSGFCSNVHVRDLLDESEPLIQARSTEMPVPNGISLGRYQLHGEIARGGMGAILKGRDVHLGRDLAIKVLLESHQHNPEVVSRFIEEAQIGGQLQHPGIAPVYELGTFPDPDRRPYFAMKLVRGQTLAALLAERKDRAGRGSPDPARAERAGRGSPDPALPTTEGLPPAPDDLHRFLAIFEQLCQTMAYAHARGVIHRDLKPSNVMVGSFGEVQVMDWGLAKVLSTGGIADEETAAQAIVERVITTVRSGSTASGSESQAGSVLGTPSYMAPEQARGEVDRIDERADVFGLGAILCEMLTGRPPFVGSTRQALREMAARGEVADAMRRLDACAADADLIELARDCLAAEPDRRPRNAGAVAQRMTSYLAGVQERLKAAELGRVEAQARAEEETKRRAVADELVREAQARANEERKRRRMTAALAASVLITACVAGGGWTIVARQRAARLAATTRVVTDALAQAERLQGQAQSAAVGDLAKWFEAMAAARHARALLVEGEPDDALADKVSAVLADFGRGQAAAQMQAAEVDRDRQLIEALETIRVSLIEHLDPKQTDAEYADTFRTFGIDLDQLDPKEAGLRIGQRSRPLELASYLDDWAMQRHRARGSSDEASWRRLFAAAQAADPDAWRVALRDQIGRADPQELRRIAADQKTLESLPASSLVWFARALIDQGDRHRAQRILEGAWRNAPDDVWVNFTRALAHYNSGGFDGPEEAARFLSVVIAIRPRSFVAHANLSAALAEQGKLDAAIDEAREALRLKPDYVVAHINLGNALREKANLDEAIAEHRAALCLRPNDVAAHTNLGLALQDQGKLDEAIAEHRAALRLKPDLAEAHCNLGLAVEKQGKLDEAIAQYRTAIRLKSDFPNAHKSLGVALKKQGKLMEAIAETHEALRLRPGYAEAHVDLGDALIEQGRLDEAIAELRTAICLKPELHDAHHFLGQAFVKTGKLDEAISEYRTALPLGHSCAGAHLDLGVALRDQGKLDEGITEFRTALRLKPDFVDAHISLGNALKDKAKFDEAITEYRAALRLKPDSDLAHQNLGVALQDQGKLDEAIAELREAIRFKTDSPKGHYDLGNALMRSGDLDKALAAYRVALRYKPEYAEAHCNLGHVFRQQGRFVEALGELKRGHELGSNDPNWPYPSAEWVRSAERLVELDAKLPAVLSGQAKPRDALETRGFAGLCYEKKFHGVSARLWAEAFQAQPSLAEDMNVQNRYNAACAAALAGSGQGKDDPPLDDAKKAHWRKQAIDWLKADLAAWSKILESGPHQAKQFITQTLQHWKADTDLAGLRDAGALAKLSGDEQKACRELWAQVDALLAKAQNTQPNSGR